MFRIFRRRSLDFTLTGYKRWLRAGRPPFEWFARLPEKHQIALALAGDEHLQDLALAIGYAVQNPAAAEAGISGDPEQIDEAAATNVALQLAQAISQRQEAGKSARPAAFSGNPTTMSGFQDRAPQGRSEPRSFLGKKAVPR